MPDSETTPFLTNYDHDEDATLVRDPEEDVTKVAPPANAHFKRHIKILTICVSAFSGIATGVLIAAFVIIQIGPWRVYMNYAQFPVQDLGITVRIITSPFFFHILISPFRGL